ncbi:MAG: diguanylate cyclase [Myxococcota bacterium]
MQKPALPEDEQRRLRTLRALELLDTPAEERFDRVTRLAQRSFGVSTALVSLVDADRQWFKSRQGLGASETSRGISFCGHSILGVDILDVPDASADERFADNPLVTGEPHIRFYAGRPLAAPDGSRVGTLCLIDPEPRMLSAEDRELLHDLAQLVEAEFAALALANVDELTGLSNRRSFKATAKKMLAVCKQLYKPASLFFIDLDRFKPINDRFGHEEGDRALREIAGILSDVFRDSDVIGRIGGDEFCVLLTGTARHNLEAPIQRFSKAVQARNESSSADYALDYSLGIAVFEPARPVSLAELMKQADEAMYEQKRRRPRG